ncbi:16S rRNA (cytosine(967)-C(5))-methyltransferase RsmB [uncultured Intestinimonas sp.]|uniref:16S rRNA (cytosine(967)-C(5))-methyltransferase RsmB n=1 Tax=uncultured Intestinimonas sp. TaxID=1689265 RepID=UPI0025E50699|nr:16S rRNA (cytosine(967)-C(5))-methyltransferase RsmB [uncultured Intestinimonas sp.]
MTGSAREVALVTLTACEKQGAWSDLALKKNIRAAGLDSRDAALATRLCFGVQQNRLLLDFYLSRFSTVKLERMERQVRNVLRLGIYQIAFLTKVPPSAAVHTSVELARRYSRNPRSPGLVNGILRSVARNAERLPVIGEQNPAAYLSIRYSHPLWLVQEWMSVLGPEETEALLAADNGRPPTAAQVNTIHFTVEYVVEALRAQGVEAALHPWMPDCLLLRATGDLEGLAPFQAGAFYIQDPAARAAVLAAGLEPGMRVLDACAAPGGKSFACAIAMEDRGGVFSCDIHSHKMALIDAGARRLGLTCIHAAVQDAKARREGWTEGFDLVLADVPCSGLGIIRKKPDIRYKDPAPLKGLPAVQGDILDNISGYVKPGGVLLYSTCTLLERENGAVVDRFLAAHPEYAPEPFVLPGPAGEVPEGRLTLWPHIHDTDGFFIAKLRRRL